MANNDSKYQLRRLAVLVVSSCRLFSKALIISLFVIVWTSCSDSPSQKSINLPDMYINQENILWNRKNLLNRNQIEDLRIESIDKLNDQSYYPQIEYYLLNKIYESDSGKILLLGRLYEMENAVWLVSYTVDNRIIDFKTVFYEEFAEGILDIKSTIVKNEITIFTVSLDLQTEEEINESSKFEVNDQLKFIKIQ